MNPQTDASDPTTTRPRASSWFASGFRSGRATPAAGPSGRSSPARAAADDPLRRWRLAAAAGLPLERPIQRAMTTLFQVACGLDALAQQVEGSPAPAGADVASALRTAHGQLNDAMETCDRLGTLLDHFLHLVSPEPSRPGHCDLHELLSLALFGARALLPETLKVVNRLPALPPVFAERVELTQALIDTLVQLGRVVPAAGTLTIDGLHTKGIVRMEFKAPEQHDIGRVGLALETAIDTVGRHRGTLDIVSRRGALKLRLCLPVAA